jgi:hypothetical protein
VAAIIAVIGFMYLRTKGDEMNNNDKVDIMRRLCQAKNMVNKAVDMLMQERESDIIVMIDTARDILQVVRLTVKPDDRQ